MAHSTTVICHCRALVPCTFQAPQQPLVACTVGVAGRRLRLTLLPPLSSAMGPGGRHDPLAVVDLGKAAEVVLLVTTGGGEGSAVIDAAGLMALSVLSALGLPETVLAVQSAGAGRDASAPVGMKDRSASRKRAEKAVGAALAGQERRAFHVDGLQDAAQLVSLALGRGRGQASRAAGR